MKPEYFSRAFVRAAAALEGLPVAEIEKLSLLDCAFTLSALPNADGLAKVRRRLAKRLSAWLDGSQMANGGGVEVFSVLGALWKYDQTCVTGGQLAGAVERLISSEARVGGPYYLDGEISVAFNAQVARFMRLAAKPLPGVQAFLAEVIEQRRFGNTELTAPCLVYVLGKACGASWLAQFVADHWHQELWLAPVHRSMALGILSGELPPPEIEQAMAALCRLQRVNGFWEGEPLLRAAKAGSGSEITATALAIEALDGYLSERVAPDLLDLRQRQYAIAQAARRTFGACTEPLRSSGLGAADRVCVADKNFEITLLPHFFSQALKAPGVLPTEQSFTLGLASFYGWMAYSIYDGFLDDGGEAANLPVANVALRASLECFRAALPNQDSFERYVARVFVIMDEANAWEVGNCRFALQDDRVTIVRLPQYGNCAQLAARSFAHVLSPMAVLAQNQTHVRQTRQVETAFRHYLIARQLCDDIHDWASDMQTGQASYVVSAILRDMRVRPGTYRLADLLPAMQKRFRQTSMPKVAKLISRHIDQSRRAFVSSRLLLDTNHVYRLLDELERLTRQSLDEHSKAQAFYEGAARFGWS